MRLEPYVRVDDTPFAVTPAELRAARGLPARRVRNGVGLNEWDYGAAVFRFQDGGRLEEITLAARVVTIGPVSVPIAALGGFVRAQDAGTFWRAGFLVSPRYGLAFDPRDPPWVTALATHALDEWRRL